MTLVYGPVKGHRGAHDAQADEAHMHEITGTLPTPITAGGQPYQYCRRIENPVCAARAIR
jgi:hypothetical protein